MNEPTATECKAASTSNYSSIEAISFEATNMDTTFGLKYSNPDNGCSLTVGLYCDESTNGAWTTTALVNQGANQSGCDYTTTLTSSEVCASFDLNALWTFLEEYDYLWGACFIIAGAFLGFFGRKLFKAAIFMVTAVLVVFAILLLFYTTFLEDTTEEWVGWTVLVCAILIGLVAGFFMMKLERFGVSLLAGWGGFLLGFFFFEMCLYPTESVALFWCISIGFALIAGVAAFFLEKHMLINMTAFGGGYMLIRGISFYAGGYPNEFTLARQLKEGNTEAFDNWFYLYMVFILLVSAAGSFVQYKTNKEDADKSPYQALN